MMGLISKFWCIVFEILEIDFWFIYGKFVLWFMKKYEEIIVVMFFVKLV